MEEMKNKLQKIKRKTKLNFYQDFYKFSDELAGLRQSGNYHFEKDPFCKGAKSIAVTLH